MKLAISRLTCLGVLLATVAASADDEPPALNPFAPRNTQRDDALPGSIELSDGSTHTGKLYLTRGVRLRIQNEHGKRLRELSLQEVRGITCIVEKQWMEREWRFKENANDEKIYTGRQYPARIYRYEFTLQDNTTISGSVAGIIYLVSSENPQAKPAKFLLHKREKGAVGSNLESLVFVKKIDLGRP